MAERCLKAASVLCAFVFVFFAPSYGWMLMDTENAAASLDAYLRQDFVTFKNVVDLDNHASDDTTSYLGIDYNLAFTSEFKDSGTVFYAKLERNGPYDYDAPLFVHNTLMTSAGVIEKYRQDELLPELEEFWFDAPLSKSYRIKAGLYAYEVGNGFVLNGGYENYGVTFSRESEDLVWRIYYSRPDVNHKNHLGPRIRQDEEQGIDYNHAAANFFATDAKFAHAEGYFWPYVGVLTDYTSPSKRDSLFTAPIRRDILGTLGAAWRAKKGRFTLNLEAARNFGQAQSEDPAYKNIDHRGYLAYAGLDCEAGKFTHRAKFLIASGNKMTPDMALNQETTLGGGRNEGFSCYSPANRNLLDAVSSSNTDMLPIVAMGGGYGLNYGIPRPGAFAAADFENLIMPCLGFDFLANQKLNIGIFLYYLRSFEHGVGTFAGEGKTLSRDLGYEGDVFIDYNVNNHVTIELLGGYFIPGNFYKEERDDAGGSILTPFVRGDTQVDCAYQIELALALKF